jgi:uncharacterized protein
MLLLSLSAVLFFLFEVDQFAQTKTRVPKPTERLNDFAGVVDEKTRLKVENVLENVKQKTGIEFDIAMIKSTAGQDIFDFSRQLALDWGIGARTSKRKSLLLVVSVNDRTSFTQFSKSVQSDLPEGVLGEMGQRMRAFIDAGQFSEGLNAGVQQFVRSLAQKLNLNAEEFEKAPQVVLAAIPSTANNSAGTSPDSSLVGTPPVKRPVAGGPVQRKHFSQKQGSPDERR